MPSRRRLTSRLLAAAALVPSVVWLLPALIRRQAPTLRDQADFFFPVKLHTVARLLAGEIPLWNPLSGAGEPWLANAQSGVFYPPTLLFAIPSAALAAALFLLVHFAIGAGGVWRFCKEEGTTDGAALFAALVWTASGPTASLSAYWNHFGGMSYLPGIAAVARSGLRTRRSGLLCTALIGLQATAGSPEATVATLAIGALFAANPRPEPETGWRPAGGVPVVRFVARGALGLALAAWLLVPLAELALHSDRRVSLSASERDSGAIRPADAAKILGLSRVPRDNSYLASLYLGPLALLAAAAAFTERERRRVAILLAAVAAGGALLALGPPPGAWLRAIPGLDRIRYPAKSLAASVFGLSVLGGLGLDAVRFRAGRGARLAAPVVAAAAAGVLALLSPGSPPVRIAAGAGVAALLALAVLSGRSGSLGSLLQVLAAVAVGASLLFASRGIFRFAPEAEIRRRGEAAARLAALPGRVVTPPMLDLARWVLRDDLYDAATLRRQREALIGYTNLLAGVRTLRTAAALPTEGAAVIGQSVDRGREARSVALAAGAASGRALWTPFPPYGWGSKKIDGFFLAPVNPYRPRLSFVSRHRLERDPDRAWRLVSEGATDPTREVVLDRDPGSRDAADSRYVLARIAEDRPERVSALVRCSSPGLLVVTDLFYPGWLAEVDGRRTALLRADGFFRAVALGAGEHRVVFRYRPVSFYAGAAVSLLALVLCLAELSRRERPLRRSRP